MKSIRWMVPVVGILLSAVADAQSDVPTEFASHSTQLLGDWAQQVETRLQSIEATEASYAGPAIIEAGGCLDCWCDTSPGVIAEGELLLYKLHNSDLGNDTQDAFHSGSRWTLGYMDDCGRSLRVRYTEFATIDDAGEEFQIETLDLEYAGRFEIGCGWHGELSGGVRWASFREENMYSFDDTIGAVVGVELRTQLTSCLTAYGNVSQSYQFGMGFDVAAPGNGRRRGTFGISEVELGAEFQRCIGGYDVFVRSGFNTQYWSGMFDGSDEDMGLIGMTFAAGFAR